MLGPPRFIKDLAMPSMDDGFSPLRGSQNQPTILESTLSLFSTLRGNRAVTF